MKNFTLLLCCLCMISFLPAYGQQQITITGTDNFATANTYGPMVTNTGVRSNRHAYIYVEELLGGIPPAAPITALAFNRTGTATVPAGATLRIYLKNVTQDDWGSGSLPWGTAIAGATLVYNADPSGVIGNSAGFKTFTLSTPFTYTGDNLAIITEYIQPAGPTATINWVYQASGGQPSYAPNQTKYISNTTTTPGDPLSSSEERHPDVQITFDATCHTPTGVTGTTNQLDSATFSWVAPAGGDPVQQYEYELRTSGAPGSGATGLTASGTTTGTTISIGNLDTFQRYAFYVRTVCTSPPPSGYSSAFFVSTIYNDNCANALPLTVGTGGTCAMPAAGSTIGATASTGTTPACSATGINDDVWYTFVATNALHFINITNTSTTTAAQVYSGSCGSLVLVAGACASTNVTVTGLTVGSTYYVRVYTTSATATVGTNFDICVTEAIANDECSGATLLSVSPTNACTASTSGTTVNSSQSANAAPTCSGTGINDDVWFKFVATSTNHMLNLDNESNTTAAAVYSGTDCSGLTQIACANDRVPLKNLTVGNTYFIRVYSTASTATTRTNFDICVVTSPSNDECTGAISVTASGDLTCNTISGTTTGATPSSEAAPTCSATGINDDVWYSFVATDTNHTVRIVDDATTLAVAIYSGSCGSLTQIGCASTNSQAGGLVAGNTYYIRVYTTSATVTTSSDFTLCIIGAPANDNCEDAVSLPMSSTSLSCTSTLSGSTFGATPSAEAAPSCSATGTADDVWYSFVATASSHVVTLSTTSVAAAIYSGTCGSLTQMPEACGAGSATATGLTPGDTYRVRVYTTSSTLSTFSEFSICVRPVAVNDSCANAITLSTSSTNTCAAAVQGTTAGASPSPEAAPSCSASGVNDDVWYSFVATSTNHSVIVDETFGTAAAAVYSGSCGGLTQLFGSCGTGYAQADSLVVGETYYVRVYTTSSTIGNYSDFSICVITNPTNDDCTGAINLAVSSSNTCGSPVNGSTAGATPSSQAAPACSGTGINDDVWYTFTATATTHTVSLTNTTSTTAVALYSGDCAGTLTEVTGGCASTSLIVNGLTIGNVYFARVYTITSTSNTFSPFTICVGVLPSNDECSNATVLTASSNGTCNAVAGSTIGSTQSANPAPSCNGTGINDDIWYSFVATTDTTVVSILDATSPTAVAVYSGVCDTLVEIACATGRVILTDLTVGNTYFVRLYTTSSTSTLYSVFSICVASPPSNDECANAMTLAGSMNGSNISANQSRNPDTCGTAISDNAQDVWYQFSPVADGDVTISLTNLSAQFDGVLQAYSGSCAALTQIGCADGPAEGEDETMTLTGLMAGQTYFVRVYGFDDVNIGTFTITLSQVVLPVTVTSFKGERAGEVNRLSWSTASEMNNAGFELQRSADGIRFGKMSFVASGAPEGNSNSPLSYSFVDERPLTTTSYYRLKQIDKDGNSRLSDIVAIKGVKAATLTMGVIYPNPAKDRLFVTVSSPKAEKITFVMTDLAGKLLKQQAAVLQAGDNSLNIQIDRLAAGSYILKAVCQDGCDNVVSKFVKQ